MGRATRIFVAGALAFCASAAVAQSPYEKLEVGTVVSTGIERGTFTKPIPLPEGDWVVVSKRTDDFEINNGRSETRKLPRYFYTMKNKQAADSPIYAMVVWFNPDALNINWGNKKCENNNPKALVDDFGLTADSTLYLCAVTWSLSNFKNEVATSATSPNKWSQLSLPGLAAYPDDIADDTLVVNLWGNKFRGTAMGFTFLIKRNADLADAAYARYIKDWIHATGLALGETLINNKASFAQPTPYPAL